VDDNVEASYYGGGIDVIAKANHYKNRMQVCHGVDKPLWITEIAASSGRPGEETIANHDLDWQARYVPQVYARALSVGVGNISWYGLTTPNQEDEQGLLFADFSPKPSFTAYQTMTAQLKGFSYSHTLSAPGIEGYAFRNAAGAPSSCCGCWRPIPPALPNTRSRLPRKPGSLIIWAMRG
jgi:hypothetical protein